MKSGNLSLVFVSYGREGIVPQSHRFLIGKLKLVIMEGEKKKPQIVLKKCGHCNKVVKSILYREGRLYDEYICLDNSEKQGEYHVFKVKTDFLVRLEMSEAGAATTGGAWILYDLYKTYEKSSSQPQAERCSQGGEEAIADNMGSADFPEPSDFSTGSEASGIMNFPEPPDVPVGDEASSIWDFLSDFDWEGIGIISGLS